MMNFIFLFFHQWQVILKERIKIEDNIFSINHEALDEDGKLQHDKTVTFLVS